MPTYEYVCKTCGDHLEAVQSFHDEALTTCPRCSGELKKVFGSVGIVFKGSGFYKNDSRNSTASVTPPSSTDTKSEVRPRRLRRHPRRARAPRSPLRLPAPSRAEHSTSTST